MSKFAKYRRVQKEFNCLLDSSLLPSLPAIQHNLQSGYINSTTDEEESAPKRLRIRSSQVVTDTPSSSHHIQSKELPA